MKIFKQQNVYDAALDRIRYLFDEFEHVVVGFSGGKDSTVLMNLAKIVAREKNRLPLKVMFLDQEIEWQATIDYVKDVMYDEDIEPMWFQIPFKLQNATSSTELWLDCWGEGKDWVRDKDPISIKENVYGTDRFHKMFPAIMKHHFNGKACYLAGVRAEESVSRTLALTGQATYKYITWGKILNKTLEQYTFYPIYDWSYLDIWKAIHDGGWQYNTHYDAMYRYGVPTREMRVSNLHHETAIKSLFILQEIEPELYAKVTTRIGGLDTAGKLGKDDYFVRELPFMFKDWREYRDYLLEKLIIDPVYNKRFADKFRSMDKRFAEHIGDPLYKTQVQSILANDVELTKLDNWENSAPAMRVKRKKSGRIAW